MGLFGKKKPASPPATVKTKSNGQLVPGRSSGFYNCWCGEAYELWDSNAKPVHSCPSCGGSRC